MQRYSWTVARSNVHHKTSVIILYTSTLRLTVLSERTSRYTHEDGVKGLWTLLYPCGQALPKVALPARM